MAAKAAPVSPLALQVIRRACFSPAGSSSHRAVTNSVPLPFSVETVVTSVEAFNAPLARGEAGMNVGVLLRGVPRDGVQRGQVLAAPRTIRPRQAFKGEVYVLSKEEGGRHTPFFGGYKPQFFFRTTNVTGEMSLPAGVDVKRNSFGLASDSRA